MQDSQQTCILWESQDTIHTKCILAILLGSMCHLSSTLVSLEMPQLRQVQ